MKPVLDFGVQPVPGEPGRYHVKSSGRGGLLYLVDLEHVVEPNDIGTAGCGCRGYEVSSGMMLYPAPDCKHIKAARLYQGLQRRFDGLRRSVRV